MIEPFRIEVPDATLEDLRERLARTRFPPPTPGVAWDYGTQREFLVELCRYWREEYDWRVHEAALHRFEHFRTTIDAAPIHFIHQRSPEPEALPLLLVHGWPGSVVEFEQVIGPLSDPAAHGGQARDAFHVVCPSLPGHGFSSPLPDTGWDVRRSALAFAELMARLGYARYGAQGGDSGAQIAGQLGLVDAERLCGLHLNLVLVAPPEDLEPSGLSDVERTMLADLEEFAASGAGYSHIQATRPQTIGYALDDSPAGLAAWILDKFRAWSDCEGDVYRVFTRDQLLTNLMLYWVTGTAHSSARMYYETMKTGRYYQPEARVEVPTGCTISPREIVRPSRRWAERRYNVVHWTEQPAGGHFAAMEQPQRLVDDVRAFFRERR